MSPFGIVLNHFYCRTPSARIKSFPLSMANQRAKEKFPKRNGALADNSLVSDKDGWKICLQK
ncbi:protein of unknown function (plasmid) [Cupriavidus taiwanensis]|nr:hypothetical protein CBM2598_U60023 [Cupriavidus taiwanensis]SPD37678.1 protein of unknown function [Cupriavidus taiwanensis]